MGLPEWSYLYDGVFVGATLAREMRNIMLLSAFVIFIPAWYLLQFLGNDGLWLSFMLFLASRGIGMHIYYRRRQTLIAILTDLPDIRTTTLRYLPWLILSPLVAVWSYLYDGVFVGATLAREMRNIMLLSAFVIFIPAWYLLQFLGNDGLWLSFMLFLASRGIGMHIYYRRRTII